MSSIKYQAHIDGLRAVAVLLVIFHHLGDWAGVSGGYVGVVVFFVISGFLITSIVNAELEAGKFTFGGFYRRRIVRLAPAYFTVLLATTLAALVWMLPAELLAYARSMAASSMFLANFHMWREVGGYFGADASTAPLLHLWSLAVEEQFYLFWPVALLIAHKVLPRRWLAWLVVAIAVAGAVVSQWGVVRYPAAAYYLLPTRMFELAVGAVLAYWPRGESGGRLAAGASWSGLLLIAYGAWTYGKETLFPGYAALAPVIGTALLLRWSGESLIGRALGTPVATLIGKISYPAYLWHWPIIAFLHLNEVALTVTVGVAVLIATFLLSWMTWKWIELPARRYLALPARKVVAMGGGVPIAASIAAAVLLVSLHGLPGRFSDSLNRKSEALLAFPNKARGRCNEGPPTAPLPPDECVLGRETGPVDLLLVGDSHANHFAGFVDVLAKDAQLRGYDMTRSSTPFLPGLHRWEMRDGELDQHEQFAPRNAYVAGLIARERYRTIVIAGNYTSFYNDEIVRSGKLEGHLAFEAGMRGALEAASASAQRVIVMTTIPRLSDRLHDCTLRAERFGRALDCTMPAVNHRDRTARIGRFFAQLKQEFPEVVWVEPDKLLCDAKRCFSEMDGLPLYKDSGHLNDIGSRLLAKKWLETFGNPLTGVQSESVAASR